MTAGGLAAPTGAVAIWRRLCLVGLIAATGGLSTLVFGRIVVGSGYGALEVLSILLFAILSVWLAFGFWTAVIGFAVMASGGDRAQLRLPRGVRPALPRTAIVMPVYNEDPVRVFAGLKAMIESLAATGQSRAFDVFVLSDTTDPEIWIDEEALWHQVSEEVRPITRLYYRRRRHNHHRKSGNLAEFCEQWGALYECMIVLDADSLLSGRTMVAMARLMAAHPRVGIIQVPPVPINGGSLFARMQQFAASVYGPLYASGAAFWGLGDANYCGHNAIIRIQPFMEHCGLPTLPGRPPLGGEILSHDFVEAALMRRGGWQVWLAPDLPDSFEEAPPTLLDHAKRDRRWCQGNLQHLQIVPARGLALASRIHLITGIMSYLSAPLWLAFLVVTLLLAYGQGDEAWNYFQADTLFPIWPIDRRVEAVGLFACSLLLLIVPKLMAAALVVFDRRRRRAHGGGLATILGTAAEIVLSGLITPILMMFHVRFVAQILLGHAVGWQPQRRQPSRTALGEAVRAHAGHTAAGLALGIGAWWIQPVLLWWLSPVVLGLTLAIPLSMAASNIALGGLARRAGLLISSAEGAPPALLTATHRHMAALANRAIALPAASRLQMLLNDPKLAALHLALLPNDGDAGHDDLASARQRLRRAGWGALTPAERLALLADPGTVDELHRIGWCGAVEPDLAA